MSRFIILAIIFAIIYFGLRKILSDWRARFKDLDDQDRARDLNERKRPDVIELEPDEDGVFRPGEKDKDGDSR